MIDRRTFVTRVAFGLVTAPLAAEAQQTGKVYRVGLISAATPLSEMAGPVPASPTVRALVQGLRALGYVEGQNLIFERRSAEGRPERFGDIVAELVQLKADVIVTAGAAAVRAAKVVTNPTRRKAPRPGAVDPCEGLGVLE